MWSLGVILFVILSGHPPFADDVQAVLFEKIRTGDYDMETPEWMDISDDAKHLVRNLLQINPLQRWTAKQALHCKWLVEDDPRLEKVVLAETYNLIRQRKSRLKNVAKTIMWMNRHSIRKSIVSAAAAAAEVMSSNSEPAAAEAAEDGNGTAKEAAEADEWTESSTQVEYSEKSIAELMAGATDEAVMI
jgi:serine/threonine protein kinase